MNIPRFVLCALLVSVATSCLSSKLTSMTLVSTRNLVRSPEILERDVRGSACTTLILGIVPTGPTPTIEKAIEDALAKVPGSNVLTGMILRTEVLFRGLYTTSCIHAQASAGVRA